MHSARVKASTLQRGLIAMTSVGSQQTNDCVIVAIANGTGMTYDEVLNSLNLSELEILDLPIRGIQNKVWWAYLTNLGWTRKSTIPRRGQEKISGIVSLISTKTVNRHLVYMKDGIVFDSHYSLGCPIKAYQSRMKQCHIREIWLPPAPEITRDDSDISLDFLKTLV